jgi:CubicO group peptidase (beta-lactamase class C family)
MTKPIAAVAAMILVEECRITLDEPLDPFLPELANRRVLKSIEGPLDATVPAHRPLTLRDLLSFRMGMGMLMAPPGLFPIQKAMDDLVLMSLNPAPPHTPDEWLRRLGTLPLMHQPGERWMYHTGSDVLGVLIARVAGQPFERFLKDRIFDPLGMRDTGFYVPGPKLGRFASCYGPSPTGSGLTRLDDGLDSKWHQPPAFPAGGAGLVSTIDDYSAFGRMMLAKGKLGSERILARPTVEAMLIDQITAEQKANSPFAPGFWECRGWGLGLSVITRRENSAVGPGQFGWSGAYGTDWVSDPTEDLVAIMMIQRFNMGPGRIHEDFRTSAYQSLDD